MSGGASLAASTGLAGASADVGLGTMIANAAGSAVQNPVFLASAVPTFGNTYADAKLEGASELEAVATAALNASLGGVVEVSAGVGNPSATFHTLLGAAKTAAQEGGENVLQGIIDSSIKKLVYDSDRPLVSLDTSEIGRYRNYLQEPPSGDCLPE